MLILHLTQYVTQVFLPFSGDANAVVYAFEILNLAS